MEGFRILFNAFTYGIMLGMAWQLEGPLWAKLLLEFGVTAATLMVFIVSF